MRNGSAEILRAVASGETFQVTNNGQVAAIISPAEGDVLSRLVEVGAVRPARRPLTELSAIRRTASTMTSAEIISDSRAT